MKKLVAAVVMFSGLSLGLVSLATDFDGDGTNDIGIYRGSSGLWSVRNVTRIYFGGSGDEPVPGDYNGDGVVEMALFRPTSGLWAVRNLTRVYFGSSGDDPLIGGDASNWRRAGSDIYFTGGGVGVGTDSPAYPFTVKDNHHGSWLAAVHNTGYAYNDYGLIVRADGGDPFLVQIINGTTALRVESDGDVGIGVNNPAYELDVAGDIRATGSVRYGGTAGNENGTAYTKPDYVFKENYRAMRTEEVEAYLEKEKHLPWITAVEEEEDGSIDMTRMAFETVETAENLQIQVIALRRLIKAQQSQIEAQRNHLSLLEGKLAKLEVAALRADLSDSQFANP
jgi:hypothetical protein